MGHPVVWIVPALVAVATIFTFWPATENEFVNWDDHRNFLQNRWYRGFGVEQIKWAFTTGLLGVYQPLSWIALSAQYVMFQLDPAGYHTVSVLLHAATAIVFYFLVLRLLPLTIELPGPAATAPLAVFAGVAAAAYALHPLRTEPVAWASSQPYVLAMLFYLLTLLCYVNATTQRTGNGLSWPWYAAAVIAYVCCVLSKAVGVMLPFVLLLMDVYPLRRIGGPRGWWGRHTFRIALEKLPFLALAFATAGLSVIATDTNAPMSQTLHGGHRVMLALFGLAFYVYKTLVPMDLLPLYPIPRPFDPGAAKFVIAAGLTIGLTTGFVLLRRRFPGGLATWAYYVLMLIPVLGIVQHGSQIAADRYTYLSCLVWPMLLAAGLLWLWRAKLRGERAGVAFVPAVATAMLAVAAVSWFTRAQTRVWRNSESLWTHVLSREDTCDYAHNNLGTAVEADGRDEEAVTHYRRAVEIEPLNIKARRNLGAALNRAGEHAEAEEQLRAAIKLAPGFANAHNSLGLVLDATGRRDEAIGHFKTAIAIGRRENDPTAEPYINLANVYLLDEKTPRMSEALELWATAIRIDPAQAVTRKNLAAALGNQKRYSEAIRVLEDGLTYDPADMGTASNLAWLLATAPDARQRDGARAVRLAEAAVRSQPSEDPRMLNSLAAAYAEVGRFEDALSTLLRAVTIAQQQGQAPLADQFTHFIPTYRSRQPYRMPAN